ncbi:MAG: XAC0095 family protein [Stenotrophomonas acidaminiphila]
MYTAPSPPAAPAYLLPEGAHALLLEVGDVMQRLAALAATEQGNHNLTAHLLCQPGVLAQCLRSLSLRINVALRECSGVTQSARDAQEAP